MPPGEVVTTMFKRRIATIGSAAVMGLGAFAAAAGIAAAPAADAAPCSQFIQPYNPYIQTCGIPNKPPVVRGASPGAGAIIACRNIPGCLSSVVNGGPGYGFGGRGY